MSQTLARGGKLRRGYIQGRGGGDQIGFVRAEEIEHRAQYRRIAKASAQNFSIQPGQAEQPLGARAVAQHPAERAKRQGGGIGRGGWAVAKNCQPHW